MREREMLEICQNKKEINIDVIGTINDERHPKKRYYDSSTRSKNKRNKCFLTGKTAEKKFAQDL